jgi:septal ring factor EnvC (AmiA/AmiB activator)
MGLFDTKVRQSFRAVKKDNNSMHASLIYLAQRNVELERKLEYINLRLKKIEAEKLFKE